MLQAEAALQKAERDLEHGVLRAPMDGVVIRREAELGSPVADMSAANGGTLVAVVADDLHLRLVAQVDENDIAEVRVGQVADVSIDAFPGETFAGKVRKVSSAGTLDQKVASFEVEVALPNDERIRVGMSADARVLVGEHRQVLLIPNAAIVRSADGPKVRLTAEGDASHFQGPQLVVNWGLHDDMVFVPLRSAKPIFGQGDGVDIMYAQPRRLDDIPQMGRQVRAVLARWNHLDPADLDALQVQSVTQYIEPFRKIGVGLQLLLGFIGTVALAMAGVGVANLMIAIVNDRRMEIAVRRACGARRGDVMLQLLVETLVIVLAGGTLGVLLGLGLVAAVAHLPLPEMIPPPRISWAVVLTTFGVLTGIGLATGVVPGRLASKVDPGTAMRVT